MTITSLEALADLGPGATIRVTSAGGAGMWTRSEDGTWEKDGVRLPDSLFSGLVQAEQVMDGSRVPLEPLDLYRGVGNSRYRYLVLGPSGTDGNIRFLRFRDQTATQVTVYSRDQVTTLRRVPDGDRPDWYQAMSSAVHVMQQAHRAEVVAFETTSQSLATAQERLHVLEAERRNRAGTVTVQVTGTSQVPSEKADGHVPGAARIDNLVSRWHAELRFDTRGPGCLCEQVTREWVAEQLQINRDEPTGTFSYTTDCGRHTQ